MPDASRVAEITGEWTTSPRWTGVERPTAPTDVVRLRGSVRIEHTLARLGAERLWDAPATEAYVAALGALTGNQAIQQVQAGLKAIYVSGWQVAADANVAGQMYPDQSLYPADSVPRAGARASTRPSAAPTRSSTPRATASRDWFAPHRRRRRGRLRRQPERLRADEGDDRRRRRRRPLRGPALLGQEVRPHGRQGPGADRRVRAEARRRPPRRRRRWACRRSSSPAPTPTARKPHHQRRRRPRPAVPHRASAPPRASSASAAASTRRSPAA